MIADAHAPAPTKLRLPDGRALAYAEYGDPSGAPLIFMHGVPSSRLSGVLLDEGARRNGVHLIAPDRPGYGGSDPLPDRTILDWADDVSAFADGLGLDRFGVMGTSGGVPYALACAVRLPERLIYAAIISGLGPLQSRAVMRGMNRESATLYTLASRSPRLGRLWIKMLARTVQRSPNLVLRQQLSYLPPVDRAIFAEPAMQELRIADMAEAFRQGSHGPSDEAVLHMTDWGFRLQDVPVEVYLWQGEADRHHPVAMGRFLERELPRVRAVFVPEAGAYGFIERLDDIFVDLTEISAGARPATDA